MKKIYNYTVYRPSGNDTALVNGIVENRSLREKINSLIMQKNPSVEQVGFIERKTSRYQLMMAGGEFCGNATRCAAHAFLNGKTGRIKIKVSGVSNLLNAGINKNGSVWAQMPISPKSTKVTQKGRIFIIQIPGTVQLVVQRRTKFSRRDKAKKQGLKLLKKFNLLNSVAGSGVMFTTQEKGKIFLEPIYWVRDIKTLFYETACGNGTTSVGLVEAQKRQESISISVIQPTGMKISTNVKFKNKKFLYAQINGPVKILRENVNITV